MNGFRYDTYCGLYCGACDILLAYKKGVEQGKTPEWNDFPAQIQQHIPHGQIICHGCKSDTVFVGCSKCPIRKCARKHPEIETCLDCKKYPCLIHKIAKWVIRFQKLEQKLPHVKIKAHNLQTIRQKGMAAWLAEQQQIWVCLDCQTNFSWYQPQCKQCGKEIASLKDYQKV